MQKSFGGPREGTGNETDLPFFRNRRAGADHRREAADKFAHDAAPDGLVITDSLFVDRVEANGVRRVDLPITHTATEVCGRPLFANIVALGAIAVLTQCVVPASLERAVLDRVPKGTEEANKKALQAGYLLGRRA